MSVKFNTFFLYVLSKTFFWNLHYHKDLFYREFFLYSAAYLFFVYMIQNRLAQKRTPSTKHWLERFSIIRFCERIDRQWSLRKRRTIHLHTNILEIFRSDRLKSRLQHKLEIT